MVEGRFGHSSVTLKNKLFDEGSIGGGRGEFFDFESKKQFS